jgi:putative NIF3 family GTP cyclohydrolase 1 type 2
MMKASELYRKLDGDFIKDGIRDVDWVSRLQNVEKYIYPTFKTNGGMGLMCGFADEIEKVYTTVFLSDKVLTYIIDGNVTNALLLSHHPTNWDLKRHNGNYAPNKAYIAKLRERNVAVYILHHPLDDYGEYSTCGTLAEALGVSVEEPAFLHYGAYCGVVGTADCATTDELHQRYTRVMGHKTSLYKYGSDNLRGENIAICPGGGNDMDVAKEMTERGIGTLVTGVSIVNDYSRETHEFERVNRINVLGGTHYGTEKFAMMKMCGYFDGLGLPCEFINDEADLYDL